MSETKPLKNASKKELSNIKGICFDIDDTFSTDGKITKEAFEALWNLKNSGLVVVPVTGRPAGWCDHIIRFWPVDAVIGENGAFVFYIDGGKRKRLDILQDEVIDDLKRKLHTLSEKIRKEFPNVFWASDQNYREFDLAIDICEDVPRWDEKDVDRLLEFCGNEGAHAKLSSIHVNTWFGDYDKMTAFKKWTKAKMPGAVKTISSLDNWIYIGDSPNDEPAFEFFNMSVGVNNIKKYLEHLDHCPTWITEGRSGEGFCELSKVLIQSVSEK